MQSFDTWESVLEHAREGKPLWYHAPLDARPVAILVVKVYLNGKIRIDPLSNQADNFTADAGHLNRFRKRGV
jgi:hypothetical protein